MHISNANPCKSIGLLLFLYFSVFIFGFSVEALSVIAGDTKCVLVFFHLPAYSMPFYFNWLKHSHTLFIYLIFFFSGELYSKSVVTFSLIHTLIKCDYSKMFFYYMNFLIDEICRPIKILSQSEIKRIQIALRVMFSWNNIWNRIEIVVPMLIIILVRVDESRLLF